MQEYSKRLGVISNEQFQAALDHFNLGTFVRAEAIPYGNFGQNVFVSSTQGEYVLRGNPHFAWQFPTEQFFANRLHEKTRTPVPWPYLIDPATDIFGWSYVLMLRMPGLHLSDTAEENQLAEEDKRGIACALGENLALMQELTWPYFGRYDMSTNSIQPFVLLHELAWPFSIETLPEIDSLEPTSASYSQVVLARIRHNLAKAQRHNDSTTNADVAWVKEVLARNQDALNDSFQPCFVMHDYKFSNVVVTCTQGTWHVSGIFDLMGAFFGDGESDLSRMTAMYIDEDIELARTFVQTYLNKKSPRPGFAERFPIYMLDDRLILWEYFQRHGLRWWDEQWTFRDWAERYIATDTLL